MTLAGPIVPAAPWTGTIVGVFKEVISILHPDGAIVSLVAREELMEARALCHSEGFPAFACAAAVRQDEQNGCRTPISFQKCILTLLPGDVASHNETTALDFSAAGIWEPSNPLSTIAPARIPQVVGQIRLTLEDEHRKGRPYEGIHAPRGFSDGIFAVAFANLKESEDFPANLVGFGPGTTPAGDDWLAGFLAALDLRGTETGSAAHKLRSRIAESLHRTTPAGKSLLLGALAGIPPAYLVSLSRAAADPETFSTGLEKAVAAALRHGATSGEDALAGFLDGLEATVREG